MKKNHGDDCDCMKCDTKRRKEDIDEAKVDKLVPDHKRSGKRLERYGNPHGSLALGGGIQRDRRADHAERRGKNTRGLKEVIQMTKKAYNKLHKDFKSDDPKKPRTTKYVPGKGTVSMRVKFVDEAKVDQGKDDAAKKNERNQRTFGNRRDSKGSARSHEDTEARRYNTAKGRGVKMKGKKDKTPVNYHKKDSDKRVDALLKSMKEGVKRDEYGDIVGGPKISKKQKAKNLSKNEPDNKIVRSEAAAWTRKAGKNKEGGLNEKGRKSYERENPGSDLKAPSKKVGNPRRKSFCARMRGMKKKLTSAKTARDPDSRINKSLRAWNCSYEWPKDKEMIETTSLKNEIIAKAQEKHKEAKQKKYKQIMDAGKAAKKKVGKDPRGVRALSKGKWGYVKNNQFTPD